MAVKVVIFTQDDDTLWAHGSMLMPSAQLVMAPRGGSAENLVKPARCKSEYAGPCKTFVCCVPGLIEMSPATARKDGAEDASAAARAGPTKRSVEAVPNDGYVLDDLIKERIDL